MFSTVALNLHLPLIGLTTLLCQTYFIHRYVCILTIIFKRVVEPPGQHLRAHKSQFSHNIVDLHCLCCGICTRLGYQRPHLEEFVRRDLQC